MIFRGFVLAVAFAVFAGDAVGDTLSPIGDWYGEIHSRKESVFEITHYKSDGSFFTEYRECWVGGSRDHIELGHWTFDDMHLNETTEMISGRSVYLITSLRIVEDDNNSWTTRIDGGDAIKIMGPREEKEVRVTSDSKLPGCNAVS